jgi:Ca2+/Na+ antiporter
MTTAQVCATLAGFLIVAIVFLYDRRRPLLNDSLSIWDVLDLVFFLTTIVLFVYVALYSIEGLGYTLGRSELDSEVEKYAWTAIMVTKTAIFLLALGFGYLLGFTRGYLKKK